MTEKKISQLITLLTQGIYALDAYVKVFNKISEVEDDFPDKEFIKLYEENSEVKTLIDKLEQLQEELL